MLLFGLAHRFSPSRKKKNVLPTQLIPSLISSEADASWDDASSICSMDTVDNIPGAGRTLDMYFFQPLGRKLEYSLGQIWLKRLPPKSIAEHIFSFWGEGTSPGDFLGLFVSFNNVNDVISFMGERRSGKTVYAGCRRLLVLTE